MKFIEVVFNFVIEHPIFGICLAFLIGTIVCAMIGFTGWAIACFVAAVIFAAIALYVHYKG
jgi:hypothetical protein